MAVKSPAPTNLWKHLGPTVGKPFIPFPTQLEALQKVKVPWPGIGKTSKKPYPRIFGLCCGRRWGKTTLGEVLMWQGIIAPDDDKGPPAVRLTADTEEHALKIWRKFIFHMENTDLAGLKRDYSREFNRVEFLNGATAQLFSANNPESLSGDGVTEWIVDEAQFLSQAAWTNLFPSVSDRHGVINMLGVAQGEGPFKEICRLGDQVNSPEFLHMSFPTWTNPYIDPWDIDFARRVLTAAEFRQLYEAAWDDGLGKVFWNIEGCKTADKIHHAPRGYSVVAIPRKGHDYFGGLDLARLQDWCVYTIWDRGGNLIAWDRFHGLSWTAQYARLAALSAEFGHPLTVVDATGIGDPVFDALLDLGMNLMEYKITTNDKKQALVNELAIRIGNGEVRYPNEPVFIEELQRMEAKRPEGTSLIKYEAPSGAHDDFVMSAALAMQVVPRADRIPTRNNADLTPSSLYEDSTTQHSAYEYV